MPPLNVIRAASAALVLFRAGLLVPEQRLVVLLPVQSRSRGA